ncbi:yecA family protein [Bradyrhizobium liaoningense]
MTKPKQGRGTRKARKTTMADYAMSFERLGQWISKRARSPTLRHPRATSLSMLDGAVAAVVAGPVSMASEEWVCPLLGVDPDAFNHDTEEFSAIAATLMRHNAISETLSTRPESFEPLFVRSPDGEVDPQPWCMGFYAVMKLRLLVWSRLLPPNGTEHLMLRPILVHCIDDAGRPLLPPARRTLGTRPSSKTPGATFQQPSRPSGSSGCLYASSAVRRPSAPSPWLRGPLVPFTNEHAAAHGCGDHGSRSWWCRCARRPGCRSARAARRNSCCRRVRWCRRRQSGRLR